jgi:hypothetical protein
MSDDRLFASNNAIGRIAYVKNLIMLAIITFVTNYIFTKYVFPFVTDEVYFIISKIIHGFLMFVYFITLLSLVDRRLFDICEKRDSFLYKNLSGIFTLTVVIVLVVILHIKKNIITFLPAELIYNVGMIALLLFSFMVLIISLFKGKISNLSYQDYKKKSKYN